ncbi:hypothetical protein [Actinokineospora sp.]|uniref:hypothetical protein n=1 Tax=Actinokineospora sp. TaxID=1872133 RepID=UPI004037D270
MSNELSGRILFVLSLVFGGTIAILAWSGSGATGAVAFVGGLALGGLWAVRGAFSRRDSSSAN